MKTDKFDDTKSVAEYLTAALRDADPSVLLAAGLSRHALYRALREKSNPSFTTVLKIVTALGFRLRAGTA